MFLSNRSIYAQNPIEEDDTLAEKLAKEGKNIIKLNRGDPPVYFPTPEYILNAYIEALKAHKTTYTNATGIPELKEAISQRYKKRYKLEVDSEGIIITQGVSEALSFLNNSLVNDGDYAILFKPYYPIYVPSLNLAGGKEILEKYDEGKNWNINVDSLESALKKLKKDGKIAKVKYLLLTNPNNPTGTVLRRDVLEKVVELANEYSLMLVSDEIYDEIVYNGALFTSVAEVARDVPFAIFNGASKDFDATGFRMGFAIIPGSDSKSMELKAKFADFARVRLSANVPAQYAFAEAISNSAEHEKSISHMVKEIESRVNFAVSMIRENPYMSIVKPNGAFYLFPKVDLRELNLASDKEFVDMLLKQESVQLTRGSGFGAPSHIRIVSLPPKDILEDAIGRINEFCRKRAQGQKVKRKSSK
ncbi:MAG: pyridoxal phosphate-dependent aminotransferase [Candidatus Micrarchaeia archaeon]